MLEKPNLDWEISLEDYECERMSYDWDVLNNKQAKAYKEADKADSGKTTNQVLKEYGVDNYDWDKWKKTHDEHILRYNKLVSIRNFNQTGNLPERIPKARGVEYDS